jgi:hypothetical protein
LNFRRANTVVEGNSASGDGTAFFERFQFLNLRRGSRLITSLAISMMQPNPVNETVFQEVWQDLSKFPGYAPSVSTWRLWRFEIGSVAGKLPAGGSLLNVGSGHGVVPRYFHKLGYKIISVDFPVTGGADPLKSLMDLGIEGHYLQVGVGRLTPG